jgi:hypothetical protein
LYLAFGNLFVGTRVDITAGYAVQQRVDFILGKQIVH